MKLFYNTFKTGMVARDKELEFCRNKNSEMFGKYFMEFEGRKTYKGVIDFIFSKSDENEVCIFCNSDIFFDETIYKASEISVNDFYAITRYNYSPNKQLHLEINPAGSQDVWIFRATKENHERIKKMNLDFMQGVPRCEQRLAFEFLNQKFNVINPYDKIRCYHYHDSGIRNYNTFKPKEVTPPPYYFIGEKIYYR